MAGGEILLLALGWTSLVIIRHVVGRSSYSPQDGLSHRCTARVGEILLLAPGWTSLILIQRVLGRFSYSPQAGYLLSLFGVWWGDSLTRPRLDISHCRSVRGGVILLLAPGWTL